MNSMRFALALVFWIASYSAHCASAWPDKPIRLIVPVAPGGGADITARAIGQALTAAWGQQIIIDNRAGAGGTVGLDIGAKASADGYTLIEASMGPLTVDVSLYKNLPYDPIRDFTPIARGVTALNLLVVHPSLPVASVKELIAYAKANPARINFGSSGAGRADHLAGEMFNTLAGVKMQHVPYKGGALAMVDLVGGNIQLIFATVSTAVTAVKAGRIRPLAVTTANRVDMFPQLPTVAEAGVPGFAVDNWYGFVGPRGLPKDIVLKAHAEINRALASPDVKSRLDALGILPFTLPTPEAFGDYIKSEISKYARVVKDSGARAE
ncbi:MAG: transporter substrate-binding protein [Betaproteobacteria bacterium]|nr:transporter substrate-binding protein [Betaproteobacteria bacterium]